MRRRLLILPAALAAAILWLGCGDDDSPNEPVQAVPIAWVSSGVVYDTLIEKKDHSFIYFGAEWCGYCKKMESETFTNATVAALIDESFNAVKIDVDADTQVVCHGGLVSCDELAQMYEVIGIPTVVFFDRRGQRVQTIVGFRNATDFAAILRGVRGGRALQQAAGESTWNPPGGTEVGGEKSAWQTDGGAL